MCLCVMVNAVFVYQALVIDCMFYGGVAAEM